MYMSLFIFFKFIIIHVKKFTALMENARIILIGNQILYFKTLKIRDCEFWFFFDLLFRMALNSINS